MGSAAAAPPDRVPVAIQALIAVGLLCYGVSSPLVRLAGDTPALAIAAWRCLLVTAVLLPVMLVRDRAALRALPAREWGLILAAGALLGAHFIAWIVSVQLTTVAAASVLVTTTPLWIALLGAAGVGERPGQATVGAIAAGVAGAALIGWGSGIDGVGSNPALGNALALGAAALFAVYLLVGRAVRQRRPVLVYFAPVNAVAAALALVGCVVAGVDLALDTRTLALVGAMALGPGLIGHGSSALALRWLPAATLGLLSLVEPVIASAIAAVAFGEIPAPMALVGMALVLGAIAVVLRR